jgi:hypothetical protein
MEKDESLQKKVKALIGALNMSQEQTLPQIRLKISVLHRWWRDFVYAWRRIPALAGVTGSG